MVRTPFAQLAHLVALLRIGRGGGYTQQLPRRAHGGVALVVATGPARAFGRALQHPPVEAGSAGRDGAAWQQQL